MTLPPRPARKRPTKEISEALRVEGLCICRPLAIERARAAARKGKAK